jgi:hypothetical protein
MGVALYSAAALARNRVVARAFGRPAGYWWRWRPWTLPNFGEIGETTA